MQLYLVVSTLTIDIHSLLYPTSSYIYAQKSKVVYLRFIALLAFAAARAPNELASACCRSLADMLPAAGLSLLLVPASLPSRLGFLKASLLSCSAAAMLPAVLVDSPSMFSRPLKDVGPFTCQQYKSYISVRCTCLRITSTP